MPLPSFPGSNVTPSPLEGLTAQMVTGLDYFKTRVDKGSKDCYIDDY